MQNIAAPPRARIGGLCLPLKSRKQPARRGSRQVRAGEGLAVGLGRVLAPCRVSVSPSGEWGGTVDSVGGLRSTGTAQLSASPTWKSLRSGRRPIAAPGMGGSSGWAMGFESKPRRPRGLNRFHPLTSVSTSAQWGRWLFLCLSLQLGLVPGRGGVPRESGGGPWLGLWLCLGWRCGPGSCGYSGGGTSLPWDLCDIRSPGNNLRSLTTPSRVPSRDN